jgi:hypothetical protein
MSRPITLVLLGGAMLTTCCCLMRPRPEPQYDENGNLIPQSSSSSGYRRSSWGWMPVFWSSGSRGWGSSWGGSSGSSGIGSVKTGGFGSTGAKVGGGISS